ncbi:MAG: hypothetical protein WDA00_01875 [Eubacteriales bacterium]
MGFLLNASYDFATPTGAANAGILIFCAVLVFFGLLWGLIRGWSRALLRLTTVVMAAVAAFLFCYYISSSMEKILSEQWMQDIVGRFSEVQELLTEAQEQFPELLTLLLAVPVSLVNPVVFVVMFFVFGIVALLLYWILAPLFCPKRRRGQKIRKGSLSRLIGLLIGALQGAAVALACLMPVMGYMNFAAMAAEVITEQAPDEEALAEVLEIHDEYVVPLSENPVLRYGGQFGGLWLFRELTTFAYQDTSIVLEDEFDTYLLMLTHALPLWETKVAEYGEEQAAAIGHLADDFDDSEILPILAAGVLSRACQTWLDDQDFFGVAKPAVDNPQMQDIMDEMLRTFKDATPQTVTEDMRSVADMLMVMAEYDMFASLSDTDSLLDLLRTEGLLSELLNTLYSNARLKTLFVELTKFGIKAVATEMNIPDDIDEAYDELMAGVADALNDLVAIEGTEARFEALQEAMQDVFDSQGVSIGEEILPFLTESLLYDFGEQLGTLTTEDIAAFFGELAIRPQEGGEETSHQGGSTVVLLSDDAEETKSGADYLREALEAIARAVADGTLQTESVVLQSLLFDGQSYHVTEEDGTDLSHMGSPDTLQTSKVTTADILRSLTAGFDGLNEETIAAEAQLLEEVVGKVLTVFVDMKDEEADDIANLDLASLGEALSLLESSVIFGTSREGEKTTLVALATATLQSPIVQNQVEINQKTIDALVNGSLGGVAGSAARVTSIVNRLTSRNGAALDFDALRPDIIWLVEHMDEDLQDLLKEVCTVELLQKFGMSSNQEAAREALLALTAQMAVLNSSDLTEAQKEQEADAVIYLMDMALLALTNAEDLFSLVPEGEDEGEFVVGKIMDSQVVTATLIDLGTHPNGMRKFDALGLGAGIDQNSKDIIRTAVNDYAERPGITATEIKALEAILDIFGILNN